MAEDKIDLLAKAVARVFEERMSVTRDALESGRKDSSSSDSALPSPSSSSVPSAETV